MSTPLLAADPPRFPLARLASAPFLSARLALCLALLVLAAVWLWSAVPAREVIPPGQVLRWGAPLSGRLSGDERTSVRLSLRAGDFVDLAVLPKGVDVELRFRDPTGVVLLAVDGPGSEDVERVYAVAQEPGEYRLEIHNLDTQPGVYEARIEKLRPAGGEGEDRRQAQAARAYDRGERSRQAGERDPARLDEARRAYEWAHRLCREACHPELQSLIHFRLGVLWQGRQDYRRSLPYFLRVLPRWQGRSTEAELRDRIGACQMRQNDLSAALGSFQKALTLSRRQGDLFWQADTLGNLGSLYAMTGELQHALDSLGEALQLWTRLGDPELIALTLANLGDVELRLGRPEQALARSGQALRVRKEAGLGSDPGLLLLRGRARMASKQWKRALADLEASLKLYLDRQDREFPAYVLNFIGLAHLKAENRAKAHAALVKAQELAARTGKDSARAAALGFRADLLSREENGWARALPLLQDAVDLYGRLQEPTSLASSLNGLGLALRHTGQPQAARKAFERCIGLVEGLREKPSAGDLRSAFFADRQDCFLNDVDLLVELNARYPGQGYGARAFEIAERAHARSFLDELAKSVQGFRGVDTGLLERLSDLERRVALAGSSRSDLVLELQAVEKEIQAASPSYTELIRPRPIRIDQLQELLDPGTVVLAYFLLDGRSVLWRISPDGVKVYPLVSRAEIEKAADNFYNAVSERPRAVRPGAERDAARRLSDLLLPEAARDLGARRLVILPDGALNRIPFSALADPAAPGSEPVLLGERHEISLLPSASVLGLLRQETTQRPSPPKDVALLAGGVFEPDDERLSPAARERARRHPTQAQPANAGLEGLVRLRSTEDEAAAVRRRVPAGMYLEALGFEANRQLAMSPELGQYKVVHFATHGLFDEDNPRRSGLVLSLYDREGQPQAGLLSLDDIYKLDLPVDLVVLSACQTALGRQVRGEGLVGLARAFMYAGAPRVIVSLWNVDDRATARLMDFFYEAYLDEKLPAAAALGQAQRRMREETEWREPYYWAGFVLQGDWR